MTWWIWILIAVTLFAIELFASTAFWLCLIAVGALIAAGANALFPEAGWLDLVVFATVSLLLVAFARQPLQRSLATASRVQPAPPNSMIGTRIPITDDMPAGTSGHVNFRGSDWTARNPGPHPIPAGTDAIITGVHGITLELQPERSA